MLLYILYVCVFVSKKTSTTTQITVDAYYFVRYSPQCLHFFLFGCFFSYIDTTEYVSFELNMKV